MAARRPARIIAAAALVPSPRVGAVAGLLSATAQLVANPMLWGVAIGLTLERVFARRQIV